jgi:hypothetical protein
LSAFVGRYKVLLMQIAARARIIGLVVASFVFPAGLLARQATGDSAGASSQQFAVLGSGHLIASTEALTNAQAHCSISVTNGVAGMQCHSEGGTAKASYHFDTTLILDGQGTAYVIACRVSLVPLGCKRLSVGSPVDGRMENGSFKVTDGDKTHTYILLASTSVGVVTPPPPPAQKQSAPPRVAPAAAPAPEKSPAAKAAAESWPARASAQGQGTSAAAPANCASASVACVMFASEPPGAEIYVDGKFSGSTPSSLALPPGTHEIRVDAPHFKEWTRSLETTAGSQVSVRATLEADGSAN